MKRGPSSNLRRDRAGTDAGRAGRGRGEFRVIVTVGPAILEPENLKAVHALGPCLFRINGAHLSRDGANLLIRRLRDVIPAAMIMIDLPGNKIRTANLDEPIPLIEGETFTLSREQVNYPPFFALVRKGDLVSAHDSIYRFEVVEAGDSSLTLLSHSNGRLSSNRGLHVRGIHREIPFLFARDLELIETARDLEVNALALSFVRGRDDLLDVKRLLGDSKIEPIAKIETLAAVRNLDEILAEVEAILIDRGDLSTEVDMLDLPEAQDRIIEAGTKAGARVYLATQFLRNMTTRPLPLIAEVFDLYRSVRLGISGIQLSEETAVGRYPVECVALVFEAEKAARKRNRVNTSPAAFSSSAS